MDKKIISLDGNIKQQTKNLKEFFGLKPEQSFQDLEIEDEEK